MRFDTVLVLVCRTAEGRRCHWGTLPLLVGRGERRAGGIPGAVRFIGLSNWCAVISVCKGVVKWTLKKECGATKRLI